MKKKKSNLNNNYKELFEQFDETEILEKDKELVKLCKDAYKEGNFKEAYKYWCEIHEVHLAKKFKEDDEKTKSMIQFYKTMKLFSNEEVYKIRGYGQEQAYIKNGENESANEDFEEEEY